ASRGRLGSSSREKPVQVPATAGPLTTGTLAVARLPGPGTAALVAVVGELPEVAVSASEVAAGLDGAEVTKLPLPGPPGADPTRPQVLRPLAALLRRRLRGLPSVMVVPVRRWGADFEQVEHVIGALRPDFLLAVVPASAKPEDVTSWCGRLGGADALAVVGAAHTTTPSTCLSAGVPIASIDGQAPGRADLAALVAERTVG
ncbi:MAG: hypothetical protein M0T80_12970, partial [Actinomycetota bacterium]|nr:hypothetical protein [Actinomycetota bacterium]